MTYRDETETLRAELDRARAELATIKNKPREVETIQWRDVYGGIANWVIATVLALIATSIGTCAASHDVYNEGHPRAVALFALICIAAAVVAVWLWIKALPRTKVKR